MRTRIPCPPFVLLILGLFVTACTAQDVSTEPVHNPIIFPRENETLWRTLSCAIHLIGASVVAYCLSRRTDRLASRGLTSHTLTRWLVILIFIDSWLFIFISGVLVSGVGLSLNKQSCNAGIYICIVLYATSKLLIYWFLSEKVYFVHRDPYGSKLRTPAYRICIVFVSGYVVIIVLAFIGRVAFLRDGHQTMSELMGPVGAGTDGQCVIGIGRAASMSLLIYDLLLNVFFTCLFVYPVYRSSKLSPGLKAIAKKTLLAATVALATSAINICILMIMHGREPGWICLAACNTDIIVNALAIYIATSFVDTTDQHHTLLGHDPLDDKKGNPISAAIGKGIRKVVPSRKHILPIVNTGITSSTRGILETSNTKGADITTKGADTTLRSVHFSPEVTRQDRTVIGYDVDLEANTGNLGAPQERAERSHVEAGSSSQAVIPTSAMVSFLPRRSVVRTDHERRRTTELNIDHTGPPPASVSDSSESNETLSRRLPVEIYLRLLELPPPETPEDTTLEVRQEGRISRNPRKRPPCLVSMAVAHARKRSKSVDTRLDEQSSPKKAGERHPVHNFSEPPSSVDDARARLKVLSALMDIGRRKRESQTSESLLEVSVVTQTDLRVELRKKRDPVLDDYNGRKYERRGRSASSSGGL